MVSSHVNPSSRVRYRTGEHDGDDSQIQRMQGMVEMMSIEQMYQDIILDYYANPVAKGLREPYQVEVHHVNTSCGDDITVRLAVQGGALKELSWDGVGCSISMSSMSMLAEAVAEKDLATFDTALAEFTRLMHGKGVVVPDELILGDAVAFAGVAKFAARVKCALLGWKAVEDAVTRIKGSTDD